MDRLNETTYNKEVKSNPSDRIVVEIGDSLQPDFKPQVKIKRWDNEVNFSMRAEEHPEAIVEEVDGVIKYITPKYEVHQYEKPEAGEDGGFEFEWVLNEIPESNVLTTTIQSKGLDFFYQPALTQEEIDSGSSRPENVIGSYAVYHSTKRDNKVGGMEYKTGKAFHIYRPEAVDANGVRTWCELNIENGTLTVTVPQEFLDNAMYPVIVDPTFGYTSAGATETVAGSDTIRCRIGTIGALGGEVSKITISAKDSGGAGLVKGVVLTTPSTSEAVLTNGVTLEHTITSTTQVWFDMNYSTGPTVSAFTDYLAGVTFGVNATTSYYRDSGGVDGDSRWDNFMYPYSDPASQTGGLNTTTNIYSIYATYTESSSSFTPSPMMHMMAQSGGLI